MGNILLQHDLNSYSLEYFDYLIDGNTTDSTILAYAYYNRAKAHFKLEEYNKSQSDILNAIDISRIIDHTDLFLLATNRRGIIERDAGNLELARSIHEDLLNLYRRMDSSSADINVYRKQARNAAHNLARYYLFEGDSMRSIELYNTAISISNQADEVFESKKDLGEILILTGNIKEAKKVLKEALSIGRDNYIIRETRHIEIYEMLANISSMEEKVSLLSKGFKVMTNYSVNKDDLVKLHKKNIVALSLNAHRQKVEAGGQISLLTYGLIGFIVLVAVGSVIAISFLIKRNKLLSKDLEHIYNTMASRRNTLQ
ncbi:MAG: hypothetical protein WBA74_06740 [Cyclobacteriaceae bacterium]